MDKKTEKKIMDLFAEQRSIEVELAMREQKKKEIQEALCALIPPETVCCGLRHIVTHNKSVSWAKIHEDLLRRRLFKPVASAVLPEIIAEYTKTSESHRVTEASKVAG